MTSATAQARADVDDVSKRMTAHDLKRRRVEARGAPDQPYRNFERCVGARAVSDSVKAFTIL